MSTFTTVFRKFSSSFDEMERKMRDFTASLEFCHGLVENITKELDAVKTRLINLKQRDLERDAVLATLKRRVEHLEKKQEEYQQAGMQNELEIVGISEAPGKNLEHIVAVLATKIGVKLDVTDVDGVSRAGPRRPPGEEQRPRSIVVRLTRRAPRNELLKAARVRRGLKSEDISAPGPSRHIYVNERLTRSNRQLLQKTRSLAKQHHYKFVWVRSGAIYTRRQEGGLAERVHSEADLFRIFSEVPSGTNTGSGRPEPARAQFDCN